jgi:hypothetical protein
MINFSGNRYEERLIANTEVVTVLSSTKHPPTRNLWAADETVLNDVLFKNSNTVNPPITLLFHSGKLARQMSLF